MRDTPMRWPSMRDTPMGIVYWRCMSIKVIIVEKLKAFRKAGLSYRISSGCNV